MKKIIVLLFLFVFVHLPLHAQQLRDYEKFIRKNFPEYVQNFPKLNFKNFKVESNNDRVLEDFKVMTVEEWSEFLKYEKDFLIYNSSKTNAVHIDTSGDIDQDVRLIIAKTKQNHRINFCGSPCRIEEAKWVNDNIFILVGNYDDIEFYDKTTEKPRIYAMIQIVDLNKKTKTTFLNKVDFSNNFYIGTLFKKRALEN